MRSPGLTLIFDLEDPHLLNALVSEKHQVQGLGASHPGDQLVLEDQLVQDGLLVLDGRLVLGGLLVQNQYIDGGLSALTGDLYAVGQAVLIEVDQ